MESREYDYVVAGEGRVDLRQALEEIGERFGVRKLRVDGGGALSSALLRQGLVDEVSLPVAPVLVGVAHTRLFRTLELSSATGLKPVRCEALPADLVHLLYEVERPA